jgi:archaeosine-15-forming tRNA-guanine transglycosylase
MLILRALDVRVNRTTVSATMLHVGMETPATRVLLARNVVRQVTTLDATTTAATVKH